MLKDVGFGSLPLRQYFLEEFEFFNFVFNCRFYFVFLVVFNFLYNDPVWLAFPGRVDEPMFWY